MWHHVTVSCSILTFNLPYVQSRFYTNIKLNNILINKNKLNSCLQCMRTEDGEDNAKHLLSTVRSIILQEIKVRSTWTNNAVKWPTLSKYKYADLADWWVCLTWSKEELQWSDHQLIERRRQLKTVLEKCNTSENIETKTSSRHSDNQTSYISMYPHQQYSGLIFTFLLQCVHKKT